MTASAFRVDVLGVGISVVDLDGAIAAFEDWIRTDHRTYVCVTGVHGVMESQRDASLLDIHNRSGLTTPDGMPVVWAGRWAGVPEMSRVYGPELMTRAMERSVRHGWTNYFYGGAPGVSELMATRLIGRFPGLKVVGTHSPPFHSLSPTEDDAEVAIINEAKPDLLWIGLSTPKQEKWMAAHLGRVDAKVMVGVGAAFDIHAGLKHSAPRFLQAAGLEWAYRLVKEPRRLWRRYLWIVPGFGAKVIRRRPVLRDWPGAASLRAGDAS